MPNQPAHTQKSKTTQLEQELERKLSSIATQKENAVAQAIAKQAGLPFSDLNAIPIDPDALMLVDEPTARRGTIAVIGQSGSALTIAVLNPRDPQTQAVTEQLRTRNFQLTLIVTTPTGLNRAYERYGHEKPQETFEVGAIDIDEKKIEALSGKIKNLSDVEAALGSASTTELLETLLAGVLTVHASDVHFESESTGARIRFRLDGLLQDVGRLSEDYYGRILNRVKVLSRLKLNIHKAPQDGRFTIRHAQTPIEVRVSVLPSEYGETIVLRLLDPRTIRADLESLGMRSDILAVVKEQLAKPNGAILTTGPTGSGKTTTLYAFVNFLNSSDTKIITIEDPIEYHIEGISQTQVDPSKDYTFANGLRAIVRQDPDIILVGEIRDNETADIALNAALTGHLVFSTIHTNDAAGTIPRLIDLGIRPPIIAPAIILAMGQRLVRRLCQKCKRATKLSASDKKEAEEQLGPIRARLSVPNLATATIYESAGCTQCNMTGYQGRIGVYEVFLVTKTMEKLILAQPAISEVRELAIKEGMVTMLQDGYLKLLEGITSLEEIRRVL
ncbi:MAG: GspE/PulE family protein [Patescibacteria group bacterium]